MRDSQFIRFLAVGALNTLFGYGVFTLLVLTGLAPGWALLIATLIGVLFNYFTTGRIVFAARGWACLPRFACVYGLTFLANLWSLKSLISAGLSPFLAQAMLLPIVIIANFALNKFLVFGSAP